MYRPPAISPGRRDFAVVVNAAILEFLDAALAVLIGVAKMLR